MTMETTMNRTAPAAVSALCCEANTLRARVAELEAERDRIAEHRDNLKEQLRVVREQLDAATDQDGYLVSAAAFDEVCNERDLIKAENTRLWAWHDEAVSRVSCHLCAVNLPQPLKRDK